MSGRKLGILCYPTPGGSGRIATQLARRWARAGDEVYLLGYERPAGLDPAVRFRHVHVAEYPLFRYPPYDQALAAEIVELYESRGVRLFHAHYALPHALALALADRMLGGGRLRFVTTLHGTDITLLGGHPAHRRALLHGLCASACVTAVSRSLAEDTQALLELEVAPHVVPNFVELERFAGLEAGGGPRAAARREDPYRLVHVSTLRPVKRVLDLIDGFALLHARLPVRLCIVGAGPERELAQRRAVSLGVAGDVDFAGHQERPESFLQGAELFVYSSRTESFGLGVLEAMAAGVPVLGPAVGGVPEVLGPRAAACLPPPARPLAWARAAERLLRDAPLWRALADEGRQRAREEFPVERALAGYEEAFAIAEGHRQDRGRD